MAKKLSKYVYRCGIHSCGRIISTAVGPAEYPTCNGNGGSHHRLMDFIEELSQDVPAHVQESDKKRTKEGRWL